MTHCRFTELIDARGTLEPQGPSLMFQLALQRILVSSTNVTSHSVIYPAALDQNTTSGSDYIARLIHSGLQDCPNQKYLLFGYSQGATVVLQGLEKLRARAADAIVSVVLVGNPFRIPGKLSDINRQGSYDNRTAYGRFAAQAQGTNDSVPVLSAALDQSGRAKDICLDVSEIAEYHD